MYLKADSPVQRTVLSATHAVYGRYQYHSCSYPRSVSLPAGIKIRVELDIRQCSTNPPQCYVYLGTNAQIRFGPHRLLQPTRRAIIARVAASFYRSNEQAHDLRDRLFASTRAPKPRLLVIHQATVTGPKCCGVATQVPSFSFGSTWLIFPVIVLCILPLVANLLKLPSSSPCFLLQSFTQAPQVWTCAPKSSGRPSMYYD